MNPFPTWSTLYRLTARKVCFKGSETYNPNDIKNISPVEIAQTKAAVRNYNQYLKDKPLINEYIDNAGRDSSLNAAGLQTTAGADLAQKEKQFNPSAPVAGKAGGAMLGSKVYGDLQRDAVAQTAAAKSGAIDSMLGLQSNVNTAQEGMARDAVTRNTTSATLEQNKDAATKSSVASVLGTIGATVNDRYKSKTTEVS
jgi:hypothetical protein